MRQWCTVVCTHSSTGMRQPLPPSFNAAIRRRRRMPLKHLQAKAISWRCLHELDVVCAESHARARACDCIRLNLTSLHSHTTRCHCQGAAFAGGVSATLSVVATRCDITKMSANDRDSRNCVLTMMKSSCIVRGQTCGAVFS